MTRVAPNYIGLRDSVVRAVQENPGQQMERIRQVLPQFLPASVAAALSDARLRGLIFSAGPKRARRYFGDEQMALGAAAAVEEEIAASRERRATEKAASDLVRRRDRRRKAAAERRALTPPKPPKPPAEKKPPRAAQPKERALRRTPGQAKQKRTGRPGAELVAAPLRMPTRFGVKVSAQQAREIIIPANVKRTYAPTPCGRFEVVGDVVGAGFMEEWRQKRGVTA